MTLHYGIKSGKRAHVILKNGDHFTDVFVERKSKYAVFKERTVAYKNIRSLTIEKINCAR